MGVSGRSSKLHREEIIENRRKGYFIGSRRHRRLRYACDAPASAKGVKIGVLADQSGTYSDFDGKWSVEAAKMAIEDFGGSVLGEKIELVDADHQNKVDVAGHCAPLV